MVSNHWFFSPSDLWGDGEVVLPADESHHALDVVRIATPDVVTVFDGEGRVARAAATRTDHGRLVVEVLDVEVRRRPRPEIAVYQGAAKGSKTDDVIERLAEMGVAVTRVFASRRSVARWGADKSRRLAERWQARSRAAAKQSRNPHAMGTGPPLGWDELLDSVAAEPSVAVLWEDADLPLRTALIEPADRIALVVGPEGGLERDEAEALADAGGQLVSLGPHILRTENAAVVTASALLFHYGLIG